MKKKLDRWKKKLLFIKNGNQYNLFVDFSNLRFPFDWRNPIGYLIALSSQFIADTYFFIFVACVVAFGLGIFLFLLAAAKDIKTDLRLLNKCAKLTKNQLRTAICGHWSAFLISLNFICAWMSWVTVQTTEAYAGRGRRAFALTIRKSSLFHNSVFGKKCNHPETNLHFIRRKEDNFKYFLVAQIFFIKIRLRKYWILKKRFFSPIYG